MKRLTEIVEENRFLLESGVLSDFDIIKGFLSQSDVIQNSPQLLVDIMKGEIDKLTRYKDKIQMWVPCESTIYMDNYEDKDLASMLTYLTNKFITETEFSDRDMKWMKTNIPRLDRKKCTTFWRPFYDWLCSQGLYMKNDSERGKDNE